MSRITFENSFPLQLIACRFIEKTWDRDKPNLPCDFWYAKTPKEDKGKPYDIIITPKDRSPSIKIEIETGETLENQWIDEIPWRSWWRGCSIPGRKVKPNRYDVFIKFSYSWRSFFAATYPYIVEVGEWRGGEPNSVEDSNTKDSWNCFVGLHKEIMTNDGEDCAHDDYATLWNLLEFQLFLKKHTK